MTTSEYEKMESIYGSIELTEQEIKVAILKEKIAKYFREYNAEYWAEKEREVKTKKVESHKEKS